MMALFEKIKRKKKRLLAEQNYEENSRLDAEPETTTRDRVVGDQNGATGVRFVYGKYPARHNACEAIAVHNVKVLTGVPSALSETIAVFQSLRAMIFGGFFGSNVYRIGKVLRYYGITYRRFFRKKKLAVPGLYIISYWNEKPLKNGIHTVTVKNDGKNYFTYNLHGHGAVSREDPAVFGKRFIVGYRIGQPTRELPETEEL